MQDEQVVLEAAELLIEAIALSEALLDGDLTEARFARLQSGVCRVGVVGL